MAVWVRADTSLVNRNPRGDVSVDRYYRDAYQDVMYTGAVGVYSRITHSLMERPYRGEHFPVVLEVGAGAGQHAQFAEGTWDTYWETDIDPELLGPSERWVRGMPVISQAADATTLDGFADDSVDRLVATCLLAHLAEPEEALRQWRRVVKPEGRVSILVPTEPGMALRLARRCVMVPKARKFGQDHLGTVYRDHCNHYPGMREMITAVFRGDQVAATRYPIPKLGWNASLFEIFHITVSAR